MQDNRKACEVMVIRRASAPSVGFLMPLIFNLGWPSQHESIGEIQPQVGLAGHEVSAISQVYCRWPEANS